MLTLLVCWFLIFISRQVCGFGFEVGGGGGGSPEEVKNGQNRKISP